MSNPDAVPVARFEYRQCWMPDLSFIPPCVTLKANVDLWNHAHAFSKALKECIGILRQKMDSEADFVIPSLMGALVPASIAMEKEMDELSPKRFVSMMQQVLGVITELAALSGVLSLPEPRSLRGVCHRSVSPGFHRPHSHRGHTSAQSPEHLARDIA